MLLDFLRERFQEKGGADAIICDGQSVSYSWLLTRLDEWGEFLFDHDIEAGHVTALLSEYTPEGIALFLAMIERALILVPLTPSAGPKRDQYLSLAQTECVLRLGQGDQAVVERRAGRAEHALYSTLRERIHPGLVLFSSGSTGDSKAAVHDLTGLLNKFRTRRHDLRTLTFMQFDHIGGVDTLLYTLSNGSCVITVTDRSPESICRAVEKNRVEVLPVTPTFLNLLLLSEAYKNFDLSSLKYITYGTEVMPESTLKRCAELFPKVTLLQKYGTTEVGTLRSKSRSSDSVWVKVGGEGYKTRIVEGLLQIKAESAMLGYLNAPSPFTDDGWFITGDAVEQDGEYIRFLGRVSEIINVGGEKVFPTEVENVIQQMPDVQEVSVFSEANPLVGHIVCARVTPRGESDPHELARRIKRFCREHLESYKVPVKIEIVAHDQHSARFKKMRRTT